MATRRKFLGILGVGAASAPLAAKEALDKSIGDLALRGDEGLPVVPSTGGNIGGWRERNAERSESIPKALDWIRGNNGKLPEHIERSYREEASYVQALDPDIACKRSWSMSVKINEQRQRNYQRNVERYLAQDERMKVRDAFEKAVGFKWPW